MKEFCINYENFIFTYKEYNKMDYDNLKWHIHPFYELLYIVDGEINYIIENKQYFLKKGSLLLVPPAYYHAVHSIIKAPYKRFCINFLDNFTDPVLSNNVFEKYDFLNFPESSPLQKIMELFMELPNNLPEETQKKLYSNLLNTFLLVVSSQKRNKPQKAQTVSKNCQDILDYINVHLTQISSLEQISNHFFFSKTYISHLFQKELHIGVMTFIRNKKILLAQQLLKEGGKIDDICYKCGFNNYVSFYRAYRKYLGTPPSKHPQYNLINLS